MSRASSWAVVRIRVVGWCGKLAFIRTLGCHVAGGCIVLRESWYLGAVGLMGVSTNLLGVRVSTNLW